MFSAFELIEKIFCQGVELEGGNEEEAEGFFPKPICQKNVFFTESIFYAYKIK